MNYCNDIRQDKNSDDGVKRLQTGREIIYDQSITKLIELWYFITESSEYAIPSWTRGHQILQYSALHYKNKLNVYEENCTC